MTKFLRRGTKNALRKIYITNEQNQIIKIIISREEIEDAIIQYNCNHLKQALNTNIFKDKIYN